MAGASLVYVACSEEGTVDSLLLGPEGTLTHLDRLHGTAAVRALTVDPQRGVLYTAQNTVPPVARAFGIEAWTGRLRPWGAAELPETTTYLCIDDRHRRLLSPSYQGGVIVEVALTQEGNVAGPGKTACAPGPQTHCAEPSPDGRQVYATSLGTDRIVWWDQASGGAGVPTGQTVVSPGSGPRHLRFNASGNRVYVLNELAGTVDVFRRDEANGDLTLVQSVGSIPASWRMPTGIIRTPDRVVEGQKVWCADLQLSSSGRYLHTTDRGSSTITTFSVDPQTGILEFIATTATEVQPRGTAVTSDGRFLLVCGELSDAVTAYRIDPSTGSLEATGRAPTGRGPLWMLTLPVGRAEYT
ncbi:lactonase family protein [Arthrobacter sp.]|uniref:lactonase family protein n=1 Tax=Arthrobacter sp. TaxID=1667 RepID=UPI003A93DD5A